MFRADSEPHAVLGWQPATSLGGGLTGEGFVGQRPAPSLSGFFFFFKYQSHHLKRNWENSIPGDTGNKSAFPLC